VSEAGWPAEWYELQAGRGCGMCADQGLEDSGWGVRVPGGRLGRRAGAAALVAGPDPGDR
jgi:hypothetical protein